MRGGGGDGVGGFFTGLQRHWRHAGCQRRWPPSQPSPKGGTGKTHRPVGVKILQSPQVRGRSNMPSLQTTPFSGAPLTIVLPVLNEAATLVPRLLALQPLRARGARVVVADGGSTDGTLALARQHADLALVAPRGRGAQMNAGAAAGIAPSPAGGRLGWGPAAQPAGALPAPANLDTEASLPTYPDATTDDTLLLTPSGKGAPMNTDAAAGFAPSPFGGRRGWGPAAQPTGALPALAHPVRKISQPSCFTNITDGILLFLHADTALPENADHCIRQVLQSGAVWGRFDVRIDSPRPVFRLIETLMNLRSRWSGVATGDQAVFVRRTAFEAVGGFEDIALMEDIALSRALLRLSRPACLRQRVTTSARRWEQHGVWRTVLLMWRLRAAYFFGANPARLARQYGYRPRES